jgi:hypothetical protein
MVFRARLDTAHPFPKRVPFSFLSYSSNINAQHLTQNGSFEAEMTRRALALVS